MKNIILKKEGNYTLIARVDEQNAVYGYVVAYCYDSDDNTWAQGTYFETLDNAMEDLQKKNIEFDDVNELADELIDFFSEQSECVITDIFCEDYEWEIRKMLDYTTKNKIMDYLEDCANSGDETACSLRKELVEYIKWNM